MKTEPLNPPGPLNITFPPRNLLIPMDFSGPALAGLEAGRLLARRWSCRVDLLCVQSNPVLAVMAADARLIGEAAPERLREALRGRLEEAGRNIPGAAARVVEGEPADEINRAAVFAGADLLVVGTHGRHGLKRLVLGSVAEAVVHSSGVPVLTVRNRPAAGWPLRILAPVRETDYSDRAALHAVEWARSLGCSLTFLHVVEGGESVEALRLMERVQRLLEERRFKASDWIWREGRPAEEILKAAEKGSFDLIALSAHVRPIWRDRIIGSTAERVLRFAAAPVLAVPSWQIPAKDADPRKSSAILNPPGIPCSDPPSP